MSPRLARPALPRRAVPRPAGAGSVCPRRTRMPILGLSRVDGPAGAGSTCANLVIASVRTVMPGPTVPTPPAPATFDRAGTIPPGGTYYPREKFVRLVGSVAQEWRDQREEVV